MRLNHLEVSFRLQFRYNRKNYDPYMILFVGNCILLLDNIRLCNDARCYFETAINEMTLKVIQGYQQWFYSIGHTALLRI